MDRNLARHIVRMAFISQRPLSELVPLLKQQCEEEEYKPYAICIAKAIHSINVEVIDKVFATYPGLEEEINKEMQTYGVIL